MAKAYGIHGFCYYHYWFNGKRLLYEPLDRKMNNPKEDLPFMMCWANENWTRAWDGLDKKVLLHQEYGKEDDLAHILHLISFFKDDRYIKVNGKPIFIIYRPNLFPDIQKTIENWRAAVREAGFSDLYIGYAQSAENQFEPKSKGFDFAFDFQPSAINCPVGKAYSLTFFEKVKRTVQSKLNLKVKDLNLYFDYSNYVTNQMHSDYKDDVYPGITPMWDNSARRKENNFILHNSTPESYKTWLKFIKDNYPWERNPENFLFINAWNEWAEGNHLEPCQKWGTAYLEATKEIVE